MPRGRAALCSFLDGLSGPRDGRGGRSSEAAGRWPGVGSGSVPVRGGGGGPLLARRGATRGVSAVVLVGATGLCSVEGVRTIAGRLVEEREILLQPRVVSKPIAEAYESLHCCVEVVRCLRDQGANDISDAQRTRSAPKKQSSRGCGVTSRRARAWPIANTGRAGRRGDRVVSHVQTCPRSVHRSRCSSSRASRSRRERDCDSSWPAAFSARAMARGCGKGCWTGG